jgi:hypothetical protein
MAASECQSLSLRYLLLLDGYHFSPCAFCFLRSHSTGFMLDFSLSGNDAISWQGAGEAPPLLLCFTMLSTACSCCTAAYPPQLSSTLHPAAFCVYL